MDKDNKEIEHIHQLIREVLAELDTEELFNPPVDSLDGRLAIRVLLHQAIKCAVGPAHGIVNKRDFGLEVLLEGLLCLAADKQNKIDKESAN